jgi:hypothetical protein
LGGYVRYTKVLISFHFNIRATMVSVRVWAMWGGMQKSDVSGIRAEFLAISALISL